MIDVATETLMTLDQAAEKLLVSKFTVNRCITHGSDGIKLEAIKFGGHWRTSMEAIQRFGERLTPVDVSAIPKMPSGHTSAKREREIAKVEEELDEALGIKKCETCRKVIEATNVTIPTGEKVWCSDCIVKRRSAKISQRLLMFRWSFNLSQPSMSAKTGISVDKIRAYESGNAKPSDAHLAKLIEVFGEKLVSGLEAAS
jgi:excisionase family DNA binding protein